MVTWRCLLDALEANNRHEIEVWVEEARVLGLEVPAGLPAALQELCRLEGESLQHFAKCKETEERVKFALEADDQELLAEVVTEAEKLGLRGPQVQQAKERLRRFQVMGPEAGAGMPSMPSRKWKAPVGASGSKTPVGGQWHPRPKSPLRRADSPPDLSSEVDGGIFAPHPGQGRGGGGSSASSFQAGGAEAGAGPSPGMRRPSKESTPYQSANVPDDGRTMKELLEECRRHGVDTRGCIDADDLRRVLVNRPQPEPEARQGFGVPSSQARQGFGVSAASQANVNQTLVWSRQFPPPQHVTRRSKALYLLGLDTCRTPSSGELRSAYRKAAMECHPDRAQNHSRQEQAKDLFQKVKEAFDYLSSQ